MPDGIRMFTSLAEDYARHRPGYPTEVLDELRLVCGLRPGWAVADIGSGTGNLARLFLAAGHRVTAVEPNREMREWAERSFADYEGYLSLDGTAEDIPIDSTSIDLITVGQALHWFDIDRARAEFERILRLGGWVAVMWNERTSSRSVFDDEYTSLCRRFVSTQPVSDPAPSLDSGLHHFFRGTVTHRAELPHIQRHDLEGLLGRARSSGFFPEPGTPGHAELTASLSDLFARHQREGAVEFHYTTQLHVGRLD